MRAQETTIYDKRSQPITLQATSGAAVTVSDSTVFEPSTLFIGTGGTIKVKMVSGVDLTFTNIPDGSFLPIVVTMVYDTGTTDAADIVRLN
jgi:hypothetical protein